MITIKQVGSFRNTEAFLKSISNIDIIGILQSFGQEGVQALASATPMDTGLVSTSWDFEVERKGSTYTLAWINSDVENGFPVAIMLQYGYGTGTGGYVQGLDYINPAIRPIFDKIADEVWKVVKSA